MNDVASFEQLPADERRLLRDALLHAVGDDQSGPTTGSARVEILQRLLGAELARKLCIFRLPTGFKLSVVMPVYNEIRTLAQVIERVRATRLPLEVVIVDDGSRDGSREYLAGLAGGDDGKNADLKILF